MSSMWQSWHGPAAGWGRAALFWVVSESCDGVTACSEGVTGASLVRECRILLWGWHGPCSQCLGPQLLPAAVRFRSVGSYGACALYR